MNDRFKQYAGDSGKSIYRISRETGIPYTTLSELMNDKSHINNITSETVCKLGMYFGCEPQELLDAFPLLDNAKGKYLGIRYQWRQAADGIEFHINDGDDDIILARLKAMIPERYRYYQSSIPELFIETYLDDKKAMEALP